MPDALIVFADDNVAPELIPHPQGKRGCVGGSVYHRRGHSPSIGRTVRHNKEVAERIARIQRYTENHANWVDRRLKGFEKQCRVAKRRYGECSCGCIIMPRSMWHRKMLEEKLKSGTPHTRCFECDRERMSRIGKAKFAILKMRGRNPRIINRKLVID